MHNKCTKYLALILLSVAAMLPVCSYAQERQAWAASNYAGINGIFNNPANSMLSPYRVEFNLISGSSAFDNNLVSIPDGIGNYFANIVAGNSPTARIFKDGDKGHGFFSYSSKLPSILVRTNHFAIGGFYKERGSLYLRNFPNELASRLILGITQQDLKLGAIDIPRNQAGALLWKELGLHFSRPIKQYTRERIDAGINVKLLYGRQGFHYFLSKPTTFGIVDTNTVTVGGVDMQFAAGNDGFGIGTDLGATLIKREGGKWFRKFYTEQDTFNTNYKFRIGASVLDLGWIYFQDASSEHIALNDITLTTPGLLSGEEIELDSLNIQMNNKQVEADSLLGLQTESGNKLTMRLPTALHLEADWNIGKGFYLFSQITYGLPAAHIHGARRPAVIGLTPRYERKKFEFSIPISLWDFRLPRIGAALRWGWFWVGTDRLVAFNKPKGFSGYDIYMSATVGINELEHSFLKPRVKRNPVHLPDIKIKMPDLSRDYVEAGYFNTVSARSRDEVELYYSGYNSGTNYFTVSDIRKDSVGAIWAKPEEQKVRWYKPWKKGYGFRLTATYKLPELKSGIYTANGTIPIVVPERRKLAEVLILIPTNTIVGESTAGGRSLHRAEKEGKRGGNIVSFRRPLEHEPFQDVIPLMDLLDSMGVRYAFLSDMEMENYNYLRKAHTLIVAGDSKHWTREARKNLDKFVDKGNNVIAFSNDFQKWHVRYKSDNKQLVCFKKTKRDPLPNPLFKAGTWNDPVQGIPRYPEFHDSTDFRTLLHRKEWEGTQKPPLTWGQKEGVIIPDIYPQVEYWLEFMRPDGTTDIIIMEDAKGNVLPFIQVNPVGKDGTLYLFDSEKPLKLQSNMERKLLRNLIQQ